MVKSFNRLKVFSTFLLIVVFIIDLIVPPGTAIGVLYVLALAVAIGENTRTILLIAILSTVLILFNFLVFFSPATTWNIYVDRIIAIITLWVIFLVAQRHRKLIQIKEKEKRDYLKTLENLLFITSHRIKQPVANCLGLMNVLDFDNPSEEDLDLIYKHLRDSANELEQCTTELTLFLNTHERRYSDIKID